MKKVLFSLVFLSILIIPIVALAGDVTDATDDFPGKDILERVKGVVYTIFGAIAVVMLMYAGLLFLTAAGNPEQISNAKKAVIWGLIGIALGLLSASIFTILEGWLTG